MKRYTAVRIFINAMEDGDIGIFIGDGICQEAKAYDRPGNFYVDGYNYMLSTALGIAMCSDRRVFVFCDDEYFLKNISETLHIAVSGCINMTLVVFISGIHSSIGKHPTIYSSVRSMSGVLFNMGYIVHDYKRHFKNSRNPVKEIRAIWAKIRGPLAVLLGVDPTAKTSDDIKVDSSIDDLQKFIKSDVPAYSYIPPISVNKLLAKEE